MGSSLFMKEFKMRATVKQWWAIILAVNAIAELRQRRVSLMRKAEPAEL
jgi:hypothetical protein